MESIATSLSLPEDLDKKVRKLASETGRTKNGLIQQALRDYISRQEILAIEQKMQAKARGLGIHTEDDVVTLIHNLRKKKNK